MTIDTKRLATDAAYWRECGALEDATHFNSGNELFYKVDGPYSYVQNFNPGWSESAHQGLAIINDSDFIPRPQAPEAEWKDGLPQWDGVSSPSPGELAVTSGGKCKVLGFDVQRKQVAVQWYDGEMGVITLAALKPIPTKAQRDRSELKQIIADSEKYGHDYITDAIIAAGWRKES